MTAILDRIDALPWHRRQLHGSSRSDIENGKTNDTNCLLSCAAYEIYTLFIFTVMHLATVGNLIVMNTLCRCVVYELVSNVSLDIKNRNISEIIRIYSKHNNKQTYQNTPNYRSLSRRRARTNDKNKSSLEQNGFQHQSEVSKCQIGVAEQQR